MKISTCVDYDPLEVTTILINAAKEQSKVGNGSATVVIKDEEGKVVVKPTVCVTFNATQPPK
jgi:hypothetical protein